MTLIRCRARDRARCLGTCATADLAQPWLSHQATEIAGRWARLVRVSFAGELGWEIHTQTEDTATVFDAVWQAGQAHGLKPFGMYALDSPAHGEGLPRLEGGSEHRLHACWKAGSNVS